jgi:hypothetical protein
MSGDIWSKGERFFLSEFTHIDAQITDTDNLENIYPSVILDVRITNDSAFRPKFKIVLRNSNTYLDCEEYGNSKGLIEFWYNWYNNDGSLIMKFHNHGHPVAADYHVTKYDPVHLQLKENAEDNDGRKREHSDFQCFDDVMNFIRLVAYVNKSIK